MASPLLSRQTVGFQDLATSPVYEITGITKIIKGKFVHDRIYHTVQEKK